MIIISESKQDDLCSSSLHTQAVLNNHFIVVKDSHESDRRSLEVTIESRWTGFRSFLGQRDCQHISLSLRYQTVSHTNEGYN